MRMHRQAPERLFATRIAIVMAAILALVVIDHLGADSAWAILSTLGGLVVGAVAIWCIR